MSTLSLQRVFQVLDDRLVAMGIAAQPVDPEETSKIHALAFTQESAHRRFELGPTQILLSGYQIGDPDPEQRLARLDELGGRVRQAMAIGAPVVPWVHSFSHEAVYFTAVAESGTGNQAVLQKLMQQLFDRDTTLPALGRLELEATPVGTGAAHG